MRFVAIATLAALVAALSGCVSGPDSLRGVEPLDGSTLRADETMMVATSVWGTAVQIARFNPGVRYDGVEAIEACLPYGETALAYGFSGFDPNQRVVVEMDINIDTFMTDTFVDICLLPGAHGADAGVWPRPWVDDHVAYKWIDSVGRFAGSGYPDATNGWQRITNDEYAADENGDFTVLVIVNHWTETPPLVWHYFTNPVVRGLP